MAKEIVRLALAACVSVAVVGCKQDPPAPASAGPATKPADPAVLAAAPSGTGSPAARPSATQPSTTAPTVAAPSTRPAGRGPIVDDFGTGQPAAAGQPATGQPATGPSATADGSELFTLPPSRGPVAHQFQQITLLRSGPSGDLEMQLTGDGIYRIRDHGHGKSYAGNGKLADEQIADWAALMKDWESLKDSYLPTPAPADADKVEIIYGGKKVVAAGNGTDNPKAFADAYKKLLALNDQARKDAAAAAATSAPASTPATPQ